MTTLEGPRAARFRLVSAGHHFLLHGLPLRHPDTHQALRAFIDSARSAALPAPDLESVLLAMLSAVEPHTAGRRPTLIERYFGHRSRHPDHLEVFQRCLTDVLRYRAIGNPHVQDAVAVILARYSDPTLTQEAAARAAGITASALCAPFLRQTGQHFGEYLRDTRLDAAAQLLLASSATVKEIFVAVGYADRAAFNHEFRERFGLTPTEYRASRIPVATPASLGASRQHADSIRAVNSTSRRVLIVDDDAAACDGLARWLRLGGHTTDVATSIRAALERARATWPDAVVIDFHLPDGDGFEFLRRLRTAAPNRYTAAVIFSADWEVEDRREEAHALGAAILSKLADLAEVERLIASASAMRALQ